MARSITTRVDRTYRYDFALDGGAVSTIALRGPRLPSGAVLLDALLHVDAAPTSGGAATMRLDSEAGGDVAAQAAYNGAPWSTLGAKRLTLTATSAPVKLTADRQPSLTIATAALTAGRFRLVLTVLEVV